MHVKKLTKQASTEMQTVNVSACSAAVVALNKNDPVIETSIVIIESNIPKLRKFNEHSESKFTG